MPFFPSSRSALPNPSHQGFTLIELSIVLVIIGLIVGGVLVGQDLIRAAAARAQISQIEKYNTAVNTFRGKYGYLPGDIKDPDASNFGFVPRGRYAGEGDGNGILEGVAFDASGQNGGEFENAGENAVFWVDLSTAKLIEGSFNAASQTTPYNSDITNVSTPSLSAYLPAAKIGHENSVYSYSYNGMNYFGIENVGLIGGSSSGWIFMATSIEGSLSVQEAYSIDKKIDDGIPLTGRVVAQFLNCCGAANLPGSISVTYAGYEQSAAQANWPHTFTCYDNGGVAGVQPTYSISQNGGAGMNCALSFRFQ